MPRSPSESELTKLLEEHPGAIDAGKVPGDRAQGHLGYALLRRMALHQTEPERYPSAEASQDTLGHLGTCATCQAILRGFRVEFRELQRAGELEQVPVSEVQSSSATTLPRSDA